MYHRSIRLSILQRFPTQADFAMAAKTHESKVSQVIRGRKKLSTGEAKKWAKVLRCAVNILEPVINKN